MFVEQYDLLMERFPRLALQLPNVIPMPPAEEPLVLPLSSEIDLIYFYGIGQGEAFHYLARFLEEKKERRLILFDNCFEKIGALLHSPRGLDLLKNPQVFLAHLGEIEQLTTQFSLPNLEVYCLPSRQGVVFQELRELILRKTLLSHSLHLDRLQGYQLFDQFLMNLRSLPHSFYANGLKGKFRGVPAIICGAGPSLTQAIPLLKTVEDKALIIGGGSTLPALSSQGILPHFGMAIDPNPEEYLRLKNSFAFEMPFLYSTRVFPQIFQTCNGPFGYMRSGIGGMLELWIEEALSLQDPLLGELLSQESISVTAICLAWAQFLGCNPIFLNGVDLAYTNQQRYASGVGPVSAEEPNRGADKMVCKQDRQGRSVDTAIRWLMESASFSHFAKKHPETTFFNTTEGGLQVEAIPYMPLEEAIQKYCTQTWNLREKVFQEIGHSPMPQETEEIICAKIEELGKSLLRIIDQLEILSGEKEGSIHLAEWELSQEMAYPYLFYDIDAVLEKEAFLRGPLNKWEEFLTLARKYWLIFNHRT